MSNDMVQQNLQRRPGWQGLVLDGPLRIFIALVLVIAGTGLAGWICRQNGWEWAYLAVFTVCMAPVSLLCGLAYRHRPFWLPTLAWWSLVGMFAIASAAIAAMGADEETANTMGIGFSLTAFGTLKKYWPRIEYVLRRQPSNQTP